MSKETHKIDIAIIGGGIIGLWSAYYILKKFPNLSVVVFESEDYLGEHTTGRNSEVLHSGIYYPQNSLKLTHCLAGNQLWREYVAKKNMPFLDCGKVIIATRGQKENLESLLQRASVNQVAGVRALDSSEIKSLSEILHIEDGFMIGSAGVLNASEALGHLRNDVEAMGGMVLTKNRVSLIEQSKEGFLLDVNGDQILTSKLVNASGLFAVDFRKNLGLTDYTNYYVKGSYLTLKKKISIDKLIYPIPPAHGLGLGVHLTLDTAGGQRFGPNTEIVDHINYSLTDSLKTEMAPAIHKVFKNIDDENLQLGYAGVRPKVKKDGELVTDFVFNTDEEHGIKNYYEFLGIESPGLTASPSLAKMLSNTI